MATDAHSTEFSKTLTSGISALVTGKDNYYILEHLVGSQYHQAGEKQEIMLDEVILGRATDCHVRFDEQFNTVSRHHASIIKDGDNWRLNQLSETNTTFLNGKAVKDSWYLQSGDEIQLAVNGPKLIFRVPSDPSGMSLSQRLDSFKDQVIRPYKTAFIIVCCIIALLIAGGVTAGIIIKQRSDEYKKHIEEIEQLNKEQREQIDALCGQLIQTNELLEETALKADSAQKKAIKAQSIAFKEKAERIKSQENLQEVQAQMQQLRDEMDSFYNGIINGENQY